MKEKRIQGLALSEGIAIASPYFFHKEEVPIPSFTIPLHKVEQEIVRYRSALSSSRADLEKLYQSLAIEGSSEVATIIYSHLQILDDPFLTTQMEEKIRKMQKNTESVFHTAISDYEKQFPQTTDAFFRERLSDVKGLAIRVLEYLHSNQPTLLLKDVPESVALVAYELNLLLCTEVEGKSICGFVTEVGGATSHAALIARAKGLPFITGIDIRTLRDEKAEVIIVDGYLGCVILSPSAPTLKKYRNKQRELQQSLRGVKTEAQSQAFTSDGHAIRIWINIGSIEDVDEEAVASVHNVGLFRTEFLLFANPTLLMEEEHQFAVYKEILCKLKGRLLTFRFFDLGRDKQIAHIPIGVQHGIQFLLHHEELFAVQLRAILRAAIKGPVRLLLPMISNVTELQQTKEMIFKTEENLRTENIPFLSNLPIGCMIELPEAVAECDGLAKESDFLSIGTNDLTHCVFGLDRSRGAPSDVFLAAHPIILRMIDRIYHSAKTHGKSLSVCGEMVVQPELLALLLGLHIEELSCCARNIPRVNHLIRNLALSDAQRIAQRALTMESAEQVLSLFKECS